MRAGAMLLEHIGFTDEAIRLTKSLDDCAAEKKFIITGRQTGATTDEFAAYIIEKI